MSLTPLVHVDGSLAGRGAGETLELGDDDRHHLRSVLRLPVGAEVELADGLGGHATATLQEAGEVRLTADVTVVPPAVPRLRLAQALPKGRKMDEVVRACVELGLDELLPVAAERSVTRLDGPRAEKALGRWRAVARSASEQSRRRHRPRIASPVAVGDLAPSDSWLVAHPGAGRSLPTVAQEVLGGSREALAVESVTVAVGPEGGWSPAEVAELEAGGARVVHLGAGVLRTEHAAAAALAVLSAVSGRWG